MKTPDPELQARIAQAVKARTDAESLLSTLLADRNASEQRFAEAGKKDPVKMLTGTSAMDNAIQSTREMIDNLDAMIASLRGDDTPSGKSGASQGNGAIRCPAPDGSPIIPTATST